MGLTGDYGAELQNGHNRMDVEGGHGDDDGTNGKRIG
jgi:hypothetical protein